MSVVDLIENQIRKYIEHKRPPIEIRDQLDIDYSYKNNTLEIFEIRPRFDNKKIYHNISIAKAKFVKSQNCWKIYWMRASGKWVGYDPISNIFSISDVLKEIEDDRHGCFWG